MYSKDGWYIIFHNYLVPEDMGLDISRIIFTILTSAFYKSVQLPFR